MNSSGDDGDPTPGFPYDSEVSQQVFYQILENTARTAEEVTHLREDLRALNEDKAEIELRVHRNEQKIQAHELALRIVQFVVGAVVLGFGGYIWTIL